MSSARRADVPADEDGRASKRLRAHYPDPLNFVPGNDTQSAEKRMLRPARPPPETEEQWTASRVFLGLSSPEGIFEQLEQLERAQNETDYRNLEPWQKFIHLTTTFVDSRLMEEEEADARLKRILGHVPGYQTRRKDKAAVYRLIRLIDQLYPLFEHRAFELLVILNIPPSRLRMQTMADMDALTSRLKPTSEPKEEMQASVPLYVPFLVRLVRPDYSADRICEALETCTLDQQEFNRFRNNYTNRQLQPRLLNTLGDLRTPRVPVDPNLEVIGLAPGERLSSTQVDPDLSSVIHLDQMYRVTVRSPFTGYRAFPLPEAIQKEALKAGARRTIDEEIKCPVPGKYTIVTERDND